MTLPRDSVTPGAASPEQLARGERWATWWRTHRRPRTDRDRWAAFDAENDRADRTNDRSWAR